MLQRDWHAMEDIRNCRLDCGGSTDHMFALVRLPALMGRTSGEDAIRVGLIDGPVSARGWRIEGAGCRDESSSACLHGTSVARILFAPRDSASPGICPGCTPLIRTIFFENAAPSATPAALAAAIAACVKDGARVINLSLAVANHGAPGEKDLLEALDWSARRDVLVVAAAGNDSSIGSSALTRHPVVIPVLGCDAAGRPLDGSNLSRSTARYGLRAPGCMSGDTWPRAFRGTSVAAPFVAGTSALLRSAFPKATAGEVRRALLETTPVARSLVPRLLDAESAYRALGG